MEIRIVVYSPVRDEHYIADIYCDGKRIFCGDGIHTCRQSAMAQAINWMTKQVWMN